MSSMAVIKQQRVGGEDVIPEEQKLWAERMRSEPVTLGQAITVNGVIETGADLCSIKVDLLKNIPHKHCGQVNDQSHEVALTTEAEKIDALPQGSYSCRSDAKLRPEVGVAELRGSLRNLPPDPRGSAAAGSSDVFQQGGTPTIMGSDVSAFAHNNNRQLLLANAHIYVVH
uniref:Uncharacterized protein n=1 Tax=Sphaerodactylus townsendi TaxID=933632 RepID=A0ACB8EML1_9SAUR